MSYKSWFWTIIAKHYYNIFETLRFHQKIMIYIAKVQPSLFQLTLPSFCNFWIKKASCELIVMIYTINKDYSPSFYAGNQSHYAIHFIMGKTPRHQTECYALSHAITKIVYQWSLVLCSNYLVKWTNCKWACSFGLIRPSCAPPLRQSFFCLSYPAFSPMSSCICVSHPERAGNWLPSKSLCGLASGEPWRAICCLRCRNQVSPLLLSGSGKGKVVIINEAYCWPVQGHSFKQ